MGSFANTLFRVMLSWLQSVASAVWSAFTSEKGGSFLEWIGSHWLIIAAVLCAVGLAADLCVYILRWRPFRKAGKDAAKEQEEIPEAHEGPYFATADEPQEEAVPSEPETARQAVYAERKQERTMQEPDLSKWEEPRPVSERVYGKPTGDPPMITGAGYVVPADSPYRRPESQNTAMTDTRQAAAEKPGSEDEPAAEPIVFRSGRRRRLKVSDLFTSPEEELYEFEAPQQFIDSRKAYHEPVYPRGWKKSEDDGE